MKVIGTVLFVFLFYAFAAAQQFTPGLRIGLNVSNLKSAQFSGSSPRVGLDAGFVFSIPMSDHLEVISEFTFSQKGATIGGYDFSGNNINYKMYYNTLQYAAVFNYFIKAPYISLQAGPFIAYNLADNDDEVYFGKTRDPNIDMSVTQLAAGIQGLDVGPVFGLSGGSERIRLNLRYMFGLINYFKSQDLNNYGYSVKGAAFQFSFTYIFTHISVR